MRIKRLEIYGFKSFPQRVLFPFPPGISAIVGPNGSGKSNVIDALRWILGEQNPRLLRVREMSDLIFAGANGRGPEFAEVRLVLENDGQGPKDLADLAEISVTRRLYRDGESEFFINNRPCRLKDIVYLFLDTGVHARGYGIIDQGQVGQFLDQSPKERRRFLEELAGVARYKVKREETERQIQRTRENLTRVQDILAEVEGRLEELRQQAEKTRAYLRLQEELKELELSRLHQLYQQHLERKKQLLQKQATLRAELQRLEEEKHGLEPKREEAQAKLALLRVDIEKQENLWQEKRQALKEVEKALEAKLRQEAQRAQRLAQIQGQWAEKKERLQSLKNHLREVQEERSRAEKEIKQAEAALKEEKEKNRGLFERREQLEAQLKEHRDKVLDLKHRLRSLEEEKKRLEREIREIEAELQKLQHERQKLKQREEALTQEQKDLTQEWQALEGRYQDLVSKQKALEAALEEQKEAVEHLREEASVLRVREKKLREEVSWLARTLEERRSTAAKVLQQKGLQVATLFELLDLAPEEEEKLELAYPELLQALVLEERFLEQALSLLEKQQIPALIFLGDSPEEFVRQRLARVEVKEELSPAQGKIVVTPQGLLLEPDGLLRLRGRETEGLLRKRRLLEQQRSALEETRGRLKEVEALLKEKTKLLEETKKTFRSQEQELSRLRKKRQEVKKRLDRLALEQEGLGERKSFLEERLKALEEKKASLKRSLAQVQEELHGLFQEKREHQLRLKTLEDEHRLLQKEIKAALARVRALELEASAAKERAKQAQREEERLLKEEVRLAREIERLQNEFEQEDRSLKEIRQQIAEEREALKAIKQEVSALQEALDHLREEERQLEKLLLDFEQKWTEITQEWAKYERRLNKVEIDLAEAELNLKHLQEQAEDLFGASLPLAEAPRAAPLKELEKQVARVKEELKGFGAVNLAALEELEKAEERHRFLLEQKADLEKALEDLESAVKQINRTCRERLKEALKEANAKLAVVFPLLFPGGSAELRFTDSEDPLLAGLDLAIRLPGKPIRYLSMLSGGEKALAALGVLCAFYLVKPGPFCVLDEVDAPLDEANTERFTRLLEELNKHSQIILVTHNKRVMEIADALFGITMEEKGVSKVVSVKLV